MEGPSLFDEFDVNDLFALSQPQPQPVNVWNSEPPLKFTTTVVPTTTTTTTTAAQPVQPQLQQTEPQAPTPQQLFQQGPQEMRGVSPSPEVTLTRSGRPSRKRTSATLDATEEDDSDTEYTGEDIGTPNKRRRARGDKKKPTDKRQLNKLAADKYRRKKREQFEQLSKATEDLNMENNKLKVKCDKLEEEVQYLKSMLVLAVRGKAPSVDLGPEAQANAASMEQAALQTDAGSRLANIEAQLCALNAMLGRSQLPSTQN